MRPWPTFSSTMTAPWLTLDVARMRTPVRLAHAHDLALIHLVGVEAVGRGRHAAEPPHLVAHGEAPGDVAGDVDAHRRADAVEHVGLAEVQVSRVGILEQAGHHLPPAASEGGDLAVVELGQVRAVAHHGDHVAKAVEQRCRDLLFDEVDPLDAARVEEVEVGGDAVRPPYRSTTGWRPAWATRVLRQPGGAGGTAAVRSGPAARRRPGPARPGRQREHA